MMQDAGADALELNIYFIAADLDMTGRDVEARYLRPRGGGEAVDLDPAGGEDRALFQRHGPTWPSGWSRPAPTAWCSSTASSSPTSTWRRWRPSRSCVLSTPFEMLLPLALDRHPARPAQGLAGRDQRHPRRRRADQGSAGRRRRGHDRLGALRGRLQPGRRRSSAACATGWRRRSTNRSSSSRAA